MNTDLQKKLNEKYNFEKEELQLIIESIPANVYFKDMEGRYQLASHVCSMLSGESDDFTIIGKTDYDIMPDKELGKRYVEEDLQVVKTGEELKYIQEMDFSGVKYYYEISKRPVHNLDGAIIGSTGFVNDITEMIKLQKQLQEYSVTDRMTGVYNRSYYEQLEKQIPEKDLPLAVIMADCNKLKIVNDAHGHKQGDYLITSTVSNIKRQLNEDDTLIRMGGDEFLILCPRCDEASCKKLISKLKLSESEVIVNQSNLSTAYGYALITDVRTSLLEAVDLADRRMYQNKASDQFHI